MSHKKEFFSRSASNFICFVGFVMKGAPSKDLLREDLLVGGSVDYFLFLMKSATMKIISSENPITIAKPMTMVTISSPDGASEATSGSTSSLVSSGASSSSGVSG